MQFLIDFSISRLTNDVKDSGFFAEQVDPRLPGDHQVAERGRRSLLEVHRPELGQIRQRRC